MSELIAGATMERNAYIDGHYRYWLERRWADGPACLFCMLNPSTADHLKDDPTIRRCMGFAKAHSCSALWVVNLYAWRSTTPEDVLKAPDPVGPANDDHIAYYASKAMMIIAGWGSLGRWDRAQLVMHLLQRGGKEGTRANRQVYCLGRTKNGMPKHPLYVEGKAVAAPFEMEARA